MATPWRVPPDLFAGRRVAVLACGPSLNQADVDTARAAGCAVVAVNNACQLAPWCDLLHACDAMWWRVHAQYALKLPGLKTTLDDSCEFKAVNHLRWKQSEPTGVTLGFSDDPGMVCTGGNSGYQAVHIAALGGAKQILLLGFDMQTTGGKSHFFGDHPPPLRNEPGELKVFAEAFKTLAPELARRGIDVVNCTAASALTCFRFANLEDVLCAAPSA